MRAKRRRTVLVLVAVVAVLVSLGVVARIVDSREEPGPLDDETPHLADFTFRPVGKCRYEPDLGGLVVRFDVRARDTGRFTVDLEAVTADHDLDLPPKHVVRYTLPFLGGQTRREFHVVVPLTEADYRDGYRKCRYSINPTGA